MEISNTDKTDNGLSVDPKSGFCYKTKIYRSVRPPVPLPPETTPISVASYVVYLLKSDPPPPTTAALIDAVTRGRIPYSDLIHRIKTLAFSLKTKCNLSKTDVAFVLSENSIHIPVLYLSLLSLGVVVSPSNPSSTKPEISRQIQLSKPAIAFSSSENAHKIPSLKYGTILLDSSEFDSFLTSQFSEIDLNFKLDRVTVFQPDTAAIMYSSGTTGDGQRSDIDSSELDSFGCRRLRVSCGEGDASGFVLYSSVLPRVRIRLLPEGVGDGAEFGVHGEVRFRGYAENHRRAESKPRGGGPSAGIEDG